MVKKKSTIINFVVEIFLPEDVSMPVFNNKIRTYLKKKNIYYY